MFKSDHFPIFVSEDAVPWTLTGIQLIREQYYIFSKIVSKVTKINSKCTLYYKSYRVIRFV